MEKYYRTLELLAEIAGEYGNNKYSVTDFALGFIPFKNGENKVKEVGTEFSDIAHWLVDEGKKNFEEYIKR